MLSLLELTPHIYSRRFSQFSNSFGYPFPSTEAFFIALRLQSASDLFCLDESSTSMSRLKMRRKDVDCLLL
jgi:hypothetical protein